MKNIKIHKLASTPMNQRSLEYVERKGMGHPDSLMDGIVDNVSVEICKIYNEVVGFTLHHNVDKGLIIGGASEVGFGKGKITKKIEVIVTGRATSEYDGKKFKINDIANDAAKEYLQKNTRFLDIDNEVIFSSRVAAGSADLSNIFMRSKEAPLANDTSFGVGYAPLSEVENLVLRTEKYLNSKEYKVKRPAVGEDIKIMGLREGEKIHLTVAIAFVAKFVNNINEYIDYKSAVTDDIIKYAKRLTQKDISVDINHGDSIGTNDVYITKSGLSCEAGDDGSVGRGNRVNGLITPFRYMSLEAAAGKNPISHVGKIYNVFANQLAGAIVEEHANDVEECRISVLSQIGRRISDPKNLSIDLIVSKGSDYAKLEKSVSGTAEAWLDGIGDLSAKIRLGKYSMF